LGVPQTFAVYLLYYFIASTGRKVLNSKMAMGDALELVYRQNVRSQRFHDLDAV
jgi:hypothetical protein